MKSLWIAFLCFKSYQIEKYCWRVSTEQVATDLDFSLDQLLLRRSRIFFLLSYKMRFYPKVLKQSAVW